MNSFFLHNNHPYNRKVYEKYFQKFLTRLDLPYLRGEIKTMCLDLLIFVLSSALSLSRSQNCSPSANFDGKISSVNCIMSVSSCYMLHVIIAYNPPQVTCHLDKRFIKKLGISMAQLVYSGMH